MSDPESMKDIWEIRKRISNELAELSDKDFLDYFRQRRPEWATADQIDALDHLEKTSHPPRPTVDSRE